MNRSVAGHPIYVGVVGLCGPTGLVNQMTTAVRKLGATSIDHEDFDIRQGFGPDLSVDIDDLVATVRSR